MGIQPTVFYIIASFTIIHSATINAPISPSKNDTKILDHHNYEYYPELNIWYKFHKVPLAWGPARALCKSENAALAMPKNIDEANILQNIFAEHPSNTLTGAALPDLLLLGFHDLFTEYEFITESGYGLDYFYRIFENGQPNQGRAANCGAMHRNGHLYDYTCTKLGVFVCQKEDKPYADELMSYTRINLDPEYKENKLCGKKYKLHTDLKTWDAARSICFSEGGNLAVIRSREEEEFLTDMLNDPKNKVKYSPWKDYAYIGLHDFFVENWFVTVTGEPLEALKYARWSSGQPNGGDKENCVSLNANGEIHDMPCTTTALYFCELPIKAQ